jgi:hypothetical protein
MECRSGGNDWPDEVACWVRVAIAVCCCRSNVIKVESWSPEMLVNDELVPSVGRTDGASNWLISSLIVRSELGDFAGVIVWSGKSAIGLHNLLCYNNCDYNNYLETTLTKETRKFLEHWFPVSRDWRVRQLNISCFRMTPRGTTTSFGSGHSSFTNSCPQISDLFSILGMRNCDRKLPKKLAGPPPPAAPS